jgi:uncharacterized protein (TIGR02001 family)
MDVQMRKVEVVSALLVVVGAFGAGTAHATDWGTLYGYVDWTSDYRFYGASESNRHGEPQGGLHWSLPDSFYAGVFATGVDFKDFRNTSYEVDVYGGRHFYFDSNDLNVELLYSVDPNTAGHPTYLPPGAILPSYNFFEAETDITHSFGAFSLSGKFILEPRPASHHGMLESANGSAAYTFNRWLKASADIGHQWVEFGAQSTYWDAGITVNWRMQWILDVRYYGTDITVASCYGQNWCKPALVAKITYNFIVL